MKAEFYFLSILFILSSTPGCSQNNKLVATDHPGSYELVKLGDMYLEGETFNATKAHTKIFLSYPDVLAPTHFSIFLLEHTEIKEDETVLDMGTGSGIQAIYAAEKARHVLATDINERALSNTMINAQRHGVENKISVRKSDLFNDIKADEKFDVIITSIPYAWNDNTRANWRLHERYFEQVGKHLNPDGRIYFITGFLDNLPYTRKLINSNQLKIIKLNMAYSKNDNLEPIVYTITHAPTEQVKADENN